MRRIVKPNTPITQVDEFWNRKFNITQFLFNKQLEFVEDESPFKVAVCSRRAGKTISCAAHLVHTAINTPGIMCLYITLSMRNAERIIWKDLKKINTDYKLDGIPREADLSIGFKNGSTIYLCGANNVTEIENFRGVPLKLVYIDECQSFREYIQDLIDDVLSPALMDYAGSLCMIGTPGPVPTGFFYECAEKSTAWSKHGWTFWDNPHIATKSGKTHQQLLDRELLRRGVEVNDPSIQREWFGKWVLDSDALVLHYNQNVNHFDTLPQGQVYNYILGVDIGYQDADALAVLAWSNNDPTTYLVEEIVQTKQGLTELVDQIRYLQNKYKVYKIVMDMGGLGKKMGEEMIKRHQIPVEAAEKTRKMENLAFLNDAVRTGKLKAKQDSRFAQDSYLVEYDKDKSRPDRLVISERYHSDIIDAVLYAFKVSPAYGYLAPEKKPVRGTKEWAESQSNEMWEKELGGFMKEHEDENSYNKWLIGED